MTRLRIKFWMALNKLFDQSNLLSITMAWLSILKCAPVKLIHLPITNSIKFATEEATNLRKTKLRSFLSCIAAILHLFQLISMQHKLSTNNRTSEHIFGWFTCIALAVLSSYTYMNHNKGKLLQIFLNNLIMFKDKYEIRYNNKNNLYFKDTLHNYSLLETLNLLIIPLLIFTVAIFPPIFVIGVHWISPCKPFLIGYFLLQECNSLKQLTNFKVLWNLFRVLIRILILVVNIWIWCFSFNEIAFGCIVVVIIGTLKIRENTKIFWKRFKNSTNIYSDALLYRQLQIINILSNTFQQDCLGILIAGAILTASMNLSALIGFMDDGHQENNVFIMLVHMLMSNNSVATMLLLVGCMVSVYMESKDKLAKTKRLRIVYKSNIVRKWTRRYWRSCSMLKTQFGDNNFLEESTPIKCLDFSFNLTAQFLLLARNK